MNPVVLGLVGAVSWGVHDVIAARASSGVGAVRTAAIVTLAILTFVPMRYIYASKGGAFAMAINAGAAIWGALIVWILLDSTRDLRSVARVSLIYPAIYFALSAIMTARTRAHSSPKGR